MPELFRLLTPYVSPGMLACKYEQPHYIMMSHMIAIVVIKVVQLRSEPLFGLHSKHGSMAH